MAKVRLLVLWTHLSKGLLLNLVVFVCIVVHIFFSLLDNFVLRQIPGWALLRLMLPARVVDGIIFFVNEFSYGYKGKAFVFER